MVSVLDFFTTLGDSLPLENIIFRLIIAIVLVLVGIFIGKSLKFLLRKLIEKTNLNKALNVSIISLFLVLIKWSIYLLFIYWALQVLAIEELIRYLSTVLLILPTLTGAVILLAVGFGIAGYLNKVVEGTELTSKKYLAAAVFHLIVAVFVIYSIKLALISQSSIFVDKIILIMLFIYGCFILIKYFKEK